MQQVARLFTLKPRREIHSKTKKNTKIRRKICIYQKFTVPLQRVSVIFNKFFNLIVNKVNRKTGHKTLSFLIIYTMNKEKTIALYKEKNVRLQLLEITIPTKVSYYNYETKSYEYFVYEYQIRKNRKIIANYKSLYLGKKKLATMTCELLLQQKFNF